jgi:hypothetical protein
MKYGHTNVLCILPRWYFMIGTLAFTTIKILCTFPFINPHIWSFGNWRSVSNIYNNKKIVLNRNLKIHWLCGMNFLIVTSFCNLLLRNLDFMKGIIKETRDEISVHSVIFSFDENKYFHGWQIWIDWLLFNIKWAVLQPYARAGQWLNQIGKNMALGHV